MSNQLGASGPNFFNSKKQEKEDSPKRKRRFWYVFVAFLAFVFLIAGYIAWQVFSDWRGRKGVELLYEGLKQEQEGLYHKQLADAFGGKTPQETLQMYIEAVESGDYELASGYFVIEKQEEELGGLNNAPEENIKNIIGLLKRLEVVDEKSMKTEVNGYDFIVSFTYYPSGVWKIVEF